MKLKNISLEHTEAKTTVQSTKDNSQCIVLITPFNKDYFIKMLNALIEDKIISTNKQLKELGELFNIDKVEIQKLNIDFYVKKRTDIAAEHTSIFKLLLSYCCFFISTSRTVKLEAAENLKKLLNEKEIKGQEPKTNFNAKEKEALANDSLNDLVTELGIRSKIK